MIAIVDYDAGNLKSVEKALVRLGEQPVVSRDPRVIGTADKVILPGVGAFGDARKNLDRFGLTGAVKEVAAKGIPLLGICLGMQLLFTASEESPGVSGLDILPGSILRIPSSDGLKIPHMGWNSLEIREESRLFAGIPQESYVYFVHSYYLKADREDDVAAAAWYGIRIHAAVESGNVYGCQFHPEKSSKVGLAILKNFIAL